MWDFFHSYEKHFHFDELPFHLSEQEFHFHAKRFRSNELYFQIQFQITYSAYNFLPVNSQQIIIKLKGGKFFISGKKSLSAKKTERGDPLGFSNIDSDAKQQKNWRGPFGEKNFRKKVSQCQKNWKGDPLVSPGMVCYAEKQEKPFWFSLLGQMVQFGAITFCRTFKNYFGQFVWIEKSHYNSRVSLHEASTKNEIGLEM